MGRKLPEGWKKWLKLKDIFEYQTKSKRKAWDWNENWDYKFITSSQEIKKFLNEADFQDWEYLVFGTWWSTSIHYLNESFSTSSDNYVVQINKSINLKESLMTKYVYYYLEANRKTFDDGFFWAWIKHISKEYINNISIIFPISLTEQQKIVYYLDEQFALIDKVEQQLDNYENHLDQLEKWILEEVYSTFKLDYYKNLSDIVINFDWKRIPLNSNQRANKKWNIPYYWASWIIDYINDYIFDWKYLLISEDWANLLARTYPIAFIAEWKFWVNNHVHVVKWIEWVAFDDYIKYYINYINISEYVTWATQPKLNQDKLNSIKVPIPDIQTQKLIVFKLDEQFKYIDVTRQEIKKQKENYKQLRKAMLNDILGGYDEFSEENVYKAFTRWSKEQRSKKKQSRNDYNN